MTRWCHWLLVAVAAASGCAPEPGSQAMTGPKELPTVTVTVEPVQSRPVRRTVSAVGTLIGYDEVTLAPKVGGRVVRITADIGDAVPPGAVLLEIDRRDYQTDVEKARRALELELARLDLKTLPAKDTFDPSKVPSVVKAQASLENADRELKRVRSVTGASDREVKAAETELKLAEASKTVAETEARAGLAAAHQKQAELEAAELKLADCTLLAPVPTGWSALCALVSPAAVPVRYGVAGRMVSEGEMVQGNPVTNAFRLVIDTFLKLRLQVPERFAPEVRIGRPVDVRVDAYADPFPGTVTRVNPTVDPANRTFEVWVLVPNGPGKLKAGGFARAELLLRTDPAVLTVPPHALVSFAGVTKVFVVEDGKAKAIELRTGVRDREWVEVIGPVPDGAMVITSGHSQIVDGSPVKLRDEPGK